MPILLILTGDEIINVEWEGKQDLYSTEGIHTVRLRVQDEHELWSDWTKITFEVITSFTAATFTAAGRKGGGGPTQSQINVAYQGTALEGKVTI